MSAEEVYDNEDEIPHLLRSWSRRKQYEARLIANELLKVQAAMFGIDLISPSSSKKPSRGSPTAKTVAPERMFSIIAGADV